MTLPIDRTAKTTLDANLVNGITSDAPAVKASDDVVYNTIDELYNYVLGLIAAGVLSPYPPAQYNRLINGGFAVNQRVVSGNVTLSAGQYGHDRWKAGSGGCTYTFSTTNNVTTITITSGSLLQVIEGLNLLSGNHTLSWTGTSQGKIGAGSYGVSGIKSSVTGGTNLSIEFNAGTLSKVQFNAGDQALPFQPRSVAEELALCQRYYEKSYNVDFAPAAVSSLGAIVWTSRGSDTIDDVTVQFKVMKRTIPTITLYNSVTGTTAQARDATTSTSLAITSGNTGHSGTQVNVTAATTSGHVYLFHYTADAEL